MKPTTAMPDSSIVLEEHHVGENDPVSYMAYSNLSNAIHEINEIMELMNLDDDLPQWADQMISEATDRLMSVKSYILSQKDRSPAAKATHHTDLMPATPVDTVHHHELPMVKIQDYSPEAGIVTPMGDYDMSTASPGYFEDYSTSSY